MCYCIFIFQIYDLMYAPTKLDVRVTNAESKTHDFPLPGPKPDYKPFYVPHGEGFAYEAEEARKCIMQGKGRFSFFAR